MPLNQQVAAVVGRGCRRAEDWAVEVGSGPRRGSLSGLAEFGERFDVTASLLAGEGGIPLSELLSTPVRGWFEMRSPGILEAVVVSHRTPRKSGRWKKMILEARNVRERLAGVTMPHPGAGSRRGTAR